MMGECGLARALLAAPSAAPLLSAPVDPAHTVASGEGSAAAAVAAAVAAAAAAPAALHFHQGLAVPIARLGPLDLGYFHRVADRVLSAFTVELWIAGGC